MKATFGDSKRMTVKVIQRVTIIATLCVAASLVCGGKASAASEFCPAASALHRIGDANSNLYSVVISAEGPRSVSGTIVVKADDGWYQFAFPNIPLVARRNKWMDRDAGYSSTTYESAPIYVRFPASSVDVYSYVSEAKTTGDTRFGWDLKGDVKCSAEAGFSMHASRLPLFADPAPVLENPRTDLDLPPPEGSAIIAATKIDPPESLDCTTPFLDAIIVNAAAPGLPDFEGDASFRGGTVLIAVQVAADGQVSDASIYARSGNRDFDEAALTAARESTYKNGTAFCEPAPGWVVFPARFSR